MADDSKAQTGPASEAAKSANEELEHWGVAPEKMRKGIELHVTLHIEGDDAPAHDFAKSTAEAVREIIKEGSSKHPELNVTIKKIAEK